MSILYFYFSRLSINTRTTAMKYGDMTLWDTDRELLLLREELRKIVPGGLNPVEEEFVIKMLETRLPPTDKQQNWLNKIVRRSQDPKLLEIQRDAKQLLEWNASANLYLIRDEKQLEFIRKMAECRFEPTPKQIDFLYKLVERYQI